MARLYLYTHDRSLAAHWLAAFEGHEATVAAPGQLLAGLLHGQPGGIVLVDLAAPGTDADTLARAVLDHPGHLFVGAYAVHDAPFAVGLLESGLRGYCNRLARPELLAQVVSVVEAGQVWVGERLMGQLLKAFGAGRPAPTGDDPALSRLTEREREVFDGVLDGKSNKVIARELDITERTVKAHVSHLLHKLDASDRMQLALRFRNTRP